MISFTLAGVVLAAFFIFMYSGFKKWKDQKNEATEGSKKWLKVNTNSRTTLKWYFTELWPKIPGHTVITETLYKIGEPLYTATLHFKKWRLEKMREKLVEKIEKPVNDSQAGKIEETLKEKVKTAPSPKTANTTRYNSIEEIVAVSAKPAAPKEETIEDILSDVKDSAELANLLPGEERLDKKIAVLEKEEQFHLKQKKVFAATTEEIVEESFLEQQMLNRDKARAERLRHEADVMSVAHLAAIKQRIAIADEKTKLAEAARTMIVAQLQTLAANPANTRNTIKDGLKMLTEISVD
jgi:hypothetical protein